MKKYSYDLMMPKLREAKTVSIAPGYTFLSIINPTDNTIEVYQGIRPVDDSSVKEQLVYVPAYTQITVPLNPGTEYTFIYYDGGHPGIKKASAYFTTENLGINGILGNPGASGTFSITGDGVGLARSKQLPAELTPAGYLPVEVKNAIDVSLNAGSNKIGTVGIDSMPDVTILKMPDVAVKSIPDVAVKSIPDVGLKAGAKVDIVNPVKLDNTTPLSVDIEKPIMVDQTIPLKVEETKASTVDAMGFTTLKKPGAFGRQLPDVNIKSAVIKAHPNNQGLVYLGNSNYQNFPLEPGAAIVVNVKNLKLIYCAADNLSDFVNVFYEVM